jgi:hypothetical protein
MAELVVCWLVVLVNRSLIPSLDEKRFCDLHITHSKLVSHSLNNANPFIILLDFESPRGLSFLRILINYFSAKTVCGCNSGFKSLNTPNITPALEKVKMYYVPLHSLLK